MTSGGETGTSGERRFAPGPWLSIALVAVAVVVVNATSDILEISRAGLDIAWWEPVTWELSSGLVIVALAPFVGWAIRRWPPRPDRLLGFAAKHLALTLPFSLAHVAAIFLMRNAVYALMGARYGFFDDGLGIVLLYEWRKDVLVYALFAFVYWVSDYLDRRRAAERAPLAPEQRIEIRDGASAAFLAPADILFLEAAGNYVEFHTAGRTHLVRGTLAAWEARLAGRGFVRIHRSRVVNRARIAAIAPTAAGDVEITLDDGRILAGSRRYRAALDSSPAA